MEYYSVTLSTAGFAVLLKINISDLERPLDLFSEVSFGPWFKLSLQVCLQAHQVPPMMNQREWEQWKISGALVVKEWKKWTDHQMGYWFSGKILK